MLVFLVINGYSLSLSDTILIKNHLTALTKTKESRNHLNTDQLNNAAGYIFDVFKLYSDSVLFQEFVTNGRTYKNIICSFGTENPKRIIVGAHYDVCGNQEGADDNATGVTGLLELARMIKGQKLNYRIDLVAYTLEEPPYFDTENMGSFIHARYLSENKIDVYGMLVLEMIGYFKDEKHSQDYPFGFLSLIYGNKGNYITLVKKFGAGRFARKFCSEFKSHRTIRTKVFSAPSSVPGIGLSDHVNYWKFGYSALMITDTAFYRNKNYHEKSDTLETLDIKRMAYVINGVYFSLTQLN